ncbi:putative taste receptor type 2 member 33 [Rhinoderma darwinii]|uniref:putative taste receptor type 2 member 33 n=1 Tax=Rhinoderma darwinii TaxID=43563 RepID=UPI003F67CF5E
MYTEELVIFAVAFLIIIIGLLINGFIVIVNLFWWIKRQTIQTIDVLITGLGLVRIVLLSVYTHNVFNSLSGRPLYHIDSFPEYVFTSIVCMNFCSLWWGSVLCVFYCVKITTYNNRLFMRLKMNISKLVPWLLLISLVISFLSSLPCKWVIFSIDLVNGTDDGNGTMEINVNNMFLINFAGSIIPFMIFCVAIYLIILSLLRHTRNMSSRDSGFSDAQRDIHLSVIQKMISFLLFNALYFVAYIMYALSLHLKITVLYLFCNICICTYTSLHSIYFIISNPELKMSFLGVFSCTWLGFLKKQTS